MCPALVVMENQGANTLVTAASRWTTRLMTLHQFTSSIPGPFGFSRDLRVISRGDPFVSAWIHGTCYQSNA